MQSMTGYGRETSRQGDWEMTVELRAVNHRFLDLPIRLPKGLTFLEDTLRKSLASLCRGHVDVQLTLRRISGSASDVSVDEALAAAYVRAAQALCASTGAENDLTVSRLLQMDGVTSVTESALDEELLTALCADTARQAAAHLTDMRLREGENLRLDLQEHLQNAAALREQILVYAPQVVEEYRQRLVERLARLPIEPVDPARLAQEVALMADKCAIDEELSRLQSHIIQMSSYLDAQGETGKKMDFLIQEMNREANTIGSKCSDARIAQCVVNLKSEIEKLREQIQNAL